MADEIFNSALISLKALRVSINHNVMDFLINTRNWSVHFVDSPCIFNQLNSGDSI